MTWTLFFAAILAVAGFILHYSQIVTPKTETLKKFILTKLTRLDCKKSIILNLIWIFFVCFQSILHCSVDTCLTSSADILYNGFIIIKVCLKQHEDIVDFQMSYALFSIRCLMLSWLIDLVVCVACCIARSLRFTVSEKDRVRQISTISLSQTLTITWFDWSESCWMQKDCESFLLHLRHFFSWSRCGSCWSLMVNHVCLSEALQWAS